MANSNTVLSVLGATASLSTTAAQSFLSGGSGVSLSIPSNWNLNGRPFQIRMIGTVTALNATSVTILPALWIGTASATTGTNASFCAPTAVSSNLASQLTMNFILEATCLWDSGSSSVVPSFSFSAGPATAGYKAYTLGTAVTGVTLGNAGSTGLNFVPYFTFSASSTNNVATLQEFSISQL